MMATSIRCCNPLQLRLRASVLLSITFTCFFTEAVSRGGLKGAELACFAPFYKAGSPAALQDPAAQIQKRHYAAAGGENEGEEPDFKFAVTDKKISPGSRLMRQYEGPLDKTSPLQEDFSASGQNDASEPSIQEQTGEFITSSSSGFRRFFGADPRPLPTQTESEIPEDTEQSKSLNIETEAERRAREAAERAEKREIQRQQKLQREETFEQVKDNVYNLIDIISEVPGKLTKAASAAKEATDAASEVISGIPSKVSSTVDAARSIPRKVEETAQDVKSNIDSARRKAADVVETVVETPRKVEAAVEQARSKADEARRKAEEIADVVSSVPEKVQQTVDVATNAVDEVKKSAKSLTPETGSSVTEDEKLRPKSSKQPFNPTTGFSGFSLQSIAASSFKKTTKKPQPPSTPPPPPQAKVGLFNFPLSNKGSLSATAKKTKPEPSVKKPTSLFESFFKSYEPPEQIEAAAKKPSSPWWKSLPKDGEN